MGWTKCNISSTSINLGNVNLQKFINALILFVLLGKISEKYSATLHNIEMLETWMQVQKSEQNNWSSGGGSWYNWTLQLAAQM